MRRVLGATLIAVLSACGEPTPPSAPVASVEVTPDATQLLIDHTVQLSVTLRDANGVVLSGRPITWASDHVGIATVNANGMVRGVGPGAAAVSATSEGVSGSAAITVLPPGVTVRFESIGTGRYHSCGQTPDAAASCWGDNSLAQLGTGSTTGSAVPVPVSSQFAIARLSVGGIHACGLSATGAAFCWGNDGHGELGAGTPGPDVCSALEGPVPCSTRSLAVAGGIRFASLAAGDAVTCGLTAGGAAYCWGDNGYGELGVGVDTASVQACLFGPCSRTPRAVSGGLTFTDLGSGVAFACGLTTSGAVYCWGYNLAGQLGTGTDGGPEACVRGACSRTPIPVSGGHTFSKLRVGRFHTCALATDGKWYCWGSNNSGQLGNGMTGPEMCQGTNPCSTVPVALAGGLSFATLFPGGRRHSCGVTSGGVAYCWGENIYGQLGDGTTANRLTPVAVAGGLTFASVSLSLYHTCALTTDSVAYCWGYNANAQLGDGSLISSNAPVRVMGQAPSAVRAVVRPNGSTRAGSTPTTMRPPVLPTRP